MMMLDQLPSTTFRGSDGVFNVAAGAVMAVAIDNANAVRITLEMRGMAS